jgi:hypothetical protein
MHVHLHAARSTLQVYLHDCSHLADVLPLVLLAPKLRPHPTLPRVFEAPKPQTLNPAI